MRISRRAMLPVKLPTPLKFLRLWILSLLLTIPVQAAPSLVLAPVMNGLPLGLHLELLEDDQGQLSLEDVLKRNDEFQASTTEIPNFGLNSSVQWARFELHNPLHQPITIILENNFSMVDHFTLYYQSPERIWLSKEGGDQSSFSSREIKTRQLAFRLQLEPGTHLFYARTSTIGANQLPLMVWTPDEFFKHNAEEYGMIGVLVGVHIVICFYNLFLFFSLKDKTYLVYVAYVACNLLFQGMILGLAQQFMSDRGLAEFVPNVMMVVSVDLIVMSSLYFSYLFLNIKKRLPHLSRLFLAVGCMDVLNMLLTLSWSLSVGTAICFVNGSLAIALVIASGYRIARQGYRPASFFLTAWSWYLLGSFLYMSNLLGFIPTSFLTRWGQFLGGAFELSILSLALGARINEKRRKQVQKINELNQALEAKVAELVNETDCRKSMAAKASHHLNNPIQAIVGFTEHTIREEKTVWKRLESMFPEDAERTPDVQDVIVSLQQSFQAIEQNSAMTLRAIKRASVISNELRVMSGVHGYREQRVTLGEFWTELQAEIKDDEILSAHDFQLASISDPIATQEAFIELVTLTKSIFYVLKEGLEAVPPKTPVVLSTSLNTSDREQPQLQICARATGIKAGPIEDWREIRFCRHLLQRFGAGVEIQAMQDELIIDITLPRINHEISGAA